jgi:hypothetical protein
MLISDNKKEKSNYVYIFHLINIIYNRLILNSSVTPINCLCCVPPTLTSHWFPSVCTRVQYSVPSSLCIGTYRWHNNHAVLKQLHGDHSFLRSQYFLSYSRNSRPYVEPVGSLSSLQELETGNMLSHLNTAKYSFPAHLITCQLYEPSFIP